MEPQIIFEDSSLIVVDKPAGWIVNEAGTTKDQPVLQTWLSKMDYPLSGSREYRSGIVHRLDKETSGVILVAKTLKAFEDLQRQFKERHVEKTYTALVHGKVNPEKGEIKAPVGRLPWRRDRFGVLPGGREATTFYRSIQEYSAIDCGDELNAHMSSSIRRENRRLSARGGCHKTIKNYKDFTLVELKPKTGRTHQIRIHLKYLGYPIVSDEFYAGRKTAREDRKWCPRLFLHASSIKFSHPTSGKALEFSYDLPQDLTQALHTLAS